MAQLVYIYRGLGASKNGCEQMMTSLKSNLPNDKYSVEFIDPEDIVDGSKLEKAFLIAFGAGYTSGFAQALGLEGQRNLRNFVHNGGTFLGFGAGGYFGCDYIEFDKGGPLEKISEREIRFYPGIGTGPVYPGFQYGTHKGLHAVPLTFHNPHFNASFSAFFDGGCSFIPSLPIKPGSEVKYVNVIAEFSELPETPAAIVESSVGKGGRAILSGVHLEYDVLSLIDREPELSHLRELFSCSEASRKASFTSLLRLLDLEIA